MKISIEQANKLLADLLDDVEVVADDKSADKDVKVEDIVKSVNDNVTAAIKPTIEEELRPVIEASLTGKALGTLRSAAGRAFNIPKKDLETLEADQILAKCKEHMSTATGQAATEWETKYNTLLQEYETEKETIESNWQAKYTTDITAANQKYINRDIDAACLSIVEKLPRKGGDLQEQAAMYRARMQANYELRYNEEKKALEFYKDGKPALNGAKAISPEDAAKEWATKAGIIATGTQHINPKEVKNDPEQKGEITKTNEVVFQGVDVMEAWANAEQ